MTEDLDQAQTRLPFALTERFDIMNSRGQMVDAWRRITVM